MFHLGEAGTGNLNDDAAHVLDAQCLVVEAQVVDHHSTVVLAQQFGGDGTPANLDPNLVVDHLAAPFSAERLIRLTDGLAAQCLWPFVLFAAKREHLDHAFDGRGEGHREEALGDKRDGSGGLAGCGESCEGDEVGGHGIYFFPAATNLREIYA